MENLNKNEFDFREVLELSYILPLPVQYLFFKCLKKSVLKFKEGGKNAK